jgi:hypothetical protein
MKAIKFFLFFLLLTFCCTLSTHAQKHPFKITLLKGVMHGADIYNHERPEAGAESENRGWNYGVNIGYFFTKHFFATTHFTYGEDPFQAYSFDYLSETYFRDDSKGQANKKLSTIGVTAGYRQPLSRFVNVSGQVGFAYFIHLDQSPAIDYIPDERFLATGFREETNLYEWDFLSASFPVKFEIEFKPIPSVPNIGIGYALGWDIEPDYGFFTGVYHGPQISFTF